MKFALAFLLSLAAAPCLAQDLRPAEPSVLYYLSLPLGAESRRDREPVVGFAFQGRRYAQAFRLDTRVLNLVESGAFEVKYLIIGAVAAGAAVAMGGKDKSVETQQAQQAEAEQQAAAQPCPATCLAFRRF